MSRPREFKELMPATPAPQPVSLFLSAKMFTDICINVDAQGKSVSLLTNPCAGSLRTEAVQQMKTLDMLENWKFLTALYQLHLQNPNASQLKKTLGEMLHKFIEPEEEKIMPRPHAANPDDLPQNRAATSKTTINISHDEQTQLIDSITAILKLEDKPLDDMMQHPEVKSIYSEAERHLHEAVNEVAFLIADSLAGNAQISKTEAFLIKAQTLLDLAEALTRRDKDSRLFVPQADNKKSFWYSAKTRAAEQVKYHELIVSSLDSREMKQLLAEEMRIDELEPKFYAAEKKFSNKIEAALPKLIKYENSRLNQLHTVSDTLRALTSEARQILGVNDEEQPQQKRGNKIAPLNTTVQADTKGHFVNRRK